MLSDSLKLIVPAASLPAEGGEPEDLVVANAEAPAAEYLLSCLTAMTRLVGDGALVLRDANGSAKVPQAMETITFSTNETDGPRISLSAGDGGDASDDWGTQAFSQALERFSMSNAVAADGSACVRFAECLAITFNHGGDDQRRVPLLAERDGQVFFYGVWEASEEELGALTSTWSGDATSGWLPIGDDDEVEGRGLRDVVFGLVALSLVTTAVPGKVVANTSQLPPPEIPIEQIEDTSAAEAAVTPIKATVVDLEAVLDITVYDAPNSKQEGARIDLGKLAEATRDNTRIIVDVAAQRAFVLIDGKVIADMPVSTARSGKYTPRGVFHITQKKVDKVSTIYHVDLPYWMRLDQSAIGLHVGDLPGKPASAGCIRLPDEVARVLYSHVQSGTAVEVVDAWADAPQWL